MTETTETDGAANGTGFDGPLSGVRVLDCTQMLAGPFTSQLLADLGAEVLKVERPDVGDLTRSIDPELGDSGMTSYFASLNRGKRSVALDLGSETGAAAFLALVETADIVIENYRPGTLEKWGLGYEALRAHNEAVIYCSISGFLPGPYRDVAAFDMVAQALGGVMSISGEAEGPPVRPGLPIGDLAGSMYAAVCILTALSARSERGGCRIEVPLYESLIALLSERAGWSLATGEAYPRLGTAHPTLEPYRVVTTADDPLALAVASDGTYEDLCNALDRPDLATDERFATNAARVANREALAAELEPIFGERGAEAWFSLLRDEGVPAAPVRDTTEVFDEPQLRESGVTSDLEIGGVSLPLVTFPGRFSNAETGTDRNPPELGEHTERVLGEVLSEAELRELDAT
jgi:formyl-CoA transferase